MHFSQTRERQRRQRRRIKWFSFLLLFLPFDNKNMMLDPSSSLPFFPAAPRSNMLPGRANEKKGRPIKIIHFGCSIPAVSLQIAIILKTLTKPPPLLLIRIALPRL